MPGQDGRLQRSRFLEAWPHARRTKIREDAQLPANAEQRGLGPFRRRLVVERRIADGAKQNRVRFLGRGEGVVRQRAVVLP